MAVLQIVITASKVVSSSPVFMELGFHISGSSRINTLIKLILLVETEEEDDDEADEDEDEVYPSHEEEEEEVENEEEDEDKSGKVLKS